MATIVQTKSTPSHIRVALVIESGRLKPVWFESSGKTSADRIFIKQICSIWTHQLGSDKIINFAVNDGANSYVLALNTVQFTWELSNTEESPFPAS